MANQSPSADSLDRSAQIDPSGMCAINDLADGVSETKAVVKAVVRHDVMRWDA
jgi:hypothetical protein